MYSGQNQAFECGMDTFMEFKDTDSCLETFAIYKTFFSIPNERCFFSDSIFFSGTFFPVTKFATKLKLTINKELFF